MATTGIVANPDDEKGVFLLKTTTTPATPDSGNAKLFVDSADDTTKQVDSTGTVTALGGGLSSPVGISDGGTGQTAKTAAFDALSPVTTRGDIIIRDASNNVRLAVGTANQYLISDGTDPAWRTPPRDEYTANEVSDYSTSSLTFVDVDATNYSLTITTNGGDVLVGFFGYVTITGGATRWDITVDGTRHAGDDGLFRSPSLSSTPDTIPSFTVLVTGLSAASHTFKLQWSQLTSGTATLYAGAGTSNKDTHPQFWVREV